jgi:hypothetical protein
MLLQDAEAAEQYLDSNYAKKKRHVGSPFRKLCRLHNAAPSDISRNTGIVLVRPFAATMLLQNAEAAEQYLDSNYAKKQRHVGSPFRKLWRLHNAAPSDVSRNTGIVLVRPLRQRCCYRTPRPMYSILIPITPRSKDMSVLLSESFGGCTMLRPPMCDRDTMHVSQGIAHHEIGGFLPATAGQ